MNTQHWGQAGAVLLLLGSASCSDLCSDACCESRVVTYGIQSESAERVSECESECERLLDDAEAAGCDAAIEVLEECVDGGYDCDANGSLAFVCDAVLTTGCVYASGGPCSVELEAVRSCRGGG